jgi:uncharacterized spore protein YtfJ
MNMAPFIETLLERLHGTATIRTIYGDAIEVEGKTIIPVARVAYGLGRGYGRPTGAEVELGRRPESGGGGVLAHPVGVVEVTREHTRFIPIAGRRRAVTWAGMLALGVAIGRLLARR